MSKGSSMRAVLVLALAGCSNDKLESQGDSGDTVASERLLPPDERGDFSPATLESAFTPAHGVELALQRLAETVDVVAGDGIPDQKVTG